ncbi:hypothetical protein H5410_064516, partial [Solanum commersonii]
TIPAKIGNLGKLQQLQLENNHIVGNFQVTYIVMFGYPLLGMLIYELYILILMQSNIIYSFMRHVLYLERLGFFTNWRKFICNLIN